MATKVKNRVYARTRSHGVTYYYGDFRDFKEVGGGQEALRQTRDGPATSDLDEALILAGRRLEELHRLRDGGVITVGETDTTRLGHFAVLHLKSKAKRSKTSEEWLAKEQQMLGVVIDFLGADTKVAKIQVIDIVRLDAHLEAVIPPSKRKLRAAEEAAEAAAGDGTKVKSAPSTRRKYLFALSNLFATAKEYGLITSNPVLDMQYKPSSETETETLWLEVWEAALLLEAARLYRPLRPDLGIGFIYPLIATYLLTGGRPAEVRGLLIKDVNFERGTVRFYPSEWRRLKNQKSSRVVRLWPQLAEILSEYLKGPNAPRGIFLFPSVDDPNKPVQDICSVLDELSVRMGRGSLPIRAGMFRHTYTSARAQTTDGGSPVSLLTVAKELGHGTSLDMINTVYGHVGDVRVRSDVVEYRIEHFREELAERLVEMVRLSEERHTYPPCLENRVAEPVERAVLELARQQPAWGYRKVAKALRQRDLQISDSGVRSVWQRNGLNSLEKRRAARDVAA